MVGILITLAIALFLGGITLVVRGLRGKRIDHHGKHYKFDDVRITQQ